MRQRSARLGAGVIAAALILVACTSADSNDPVRGGTLRVGVVGLASLDPALADEPTEALVAEMLFTPLVGLNRRTQEPGPALAARWSVNDDQTRFEFTLRQGLEFSNGDPITAADVKTTLDRVATPANESPLAGLLAPVAGFAEVASGAAEDLSGIEIPDDRTVVITLSPPFAARPSVRAHPGLAAVPVAGRAARSEGSTIRAPHRSGPGPAVWAAQTTVTTSDAAPTRTRDCPGSRRCASSLMRMTPRPRRR